MCSYKFKKQGGVVVVDISPQSLSHINGRPVLQPYNNSHKKNTSNFKISPPPISPKIKSPRQQSIKKVNDSNVLNISNEKIVTPKIPKVKNSTLTTPPISPKIKKMKNDSKNTILINNSCKKDSSFMILEVAGSIAAARKEQVANMQVQRKQRIAHYGRTNSAKFNDAKLVTTAAVDSCSKEGKRCSFITPNSGNYKNLTS